jgi:hypothetical protein
MQRVSRGSTDNSDYRERHVMMNDDGTRTRRAHAVQARASVVERVVPHRGGLHAQDSAEIWEEELGP